MKSTYQSARTLVLEFLQGLRCAHTYQPHRNPETLFGLLWGLPIPIFALAIHLHAAGESFSTAAMIDVMRQQPIYLGFAAHPLLFAIIFGAHGTMRARRDQQIQTLIVDLERHCAEVGKANDKLTELDRLKSEFLANVTHELKSPLVTALGYSERILSEKLGPISDRQRSALVVSKRNLTRLRTLIEEILDFSRLEAGVGRFQVADVNLCQIISTAVSDLALKAKERAISLETACPPESAFTRGDAAKLAQAVINLIDNAIKFSPDGARVQVAVAAENGTWHLRVIDQGKGIAPENMPILFNRFSQVDGTTSRPYSGVGLGLVIVKKIVEGHSGEVWLESKPGCGTTAHVILKRTNEPEVQTKEVEYVTNSSR